MNHDRFVLPLSSRGDRRRPLRPEGRQSGGARAGRAADPRWLLSRRRGLSPPGRALDLEASARGAFATDDRRRGAAARAADEARAARAADRCRQSSTRSSRRGASWSSEPVRLTVVRSSALVEDRYGSSFAGQFESYLGLESEAEFLTAVRACWAALWSTRALRYMATHDLDPADTAWRCSSSRSCARARPAAA